MTVTGTVDQSRVLDGIVDIIRKFCFSITYSITLSLVRESPFILVPGIYYPGLPVFMVVYGLRYPSVLVP